MVTKRVQSKLIESEIRRAETLPTQFYKDQKYFDKAREKIFASSWQFALLTDNLKDHSAVPFTLLLGFLDEPLLFTRNKDGAISCLSNVCTHRGNVLVTDSSNNQQLRCGYHGRCFDLTGHFASTPGFEEAIDFPAKRDNLSSVPMAFWDKFIFVGIDPAYSIDELIGSMRSRLSWLPLHEFTFVADLSRDYQVKANWMLYAENFLEGFHIPYVHPGLAATMDIRKYRSESYGYSNLQIGIAADGEDVFDIPESSPDFGEKIGAYYYFLFPNMIFDFYPWGLSINVIEPVALEQTRIRYLTYVWNKSKLPDLAMELLHKTELEDEAIVERVAIGIKSRFYKRGRYSPQWEQNVYHFQQLVAQALHDGDDD
jgi:choline monooxygenase